MAAVDRRRGARRVRGWLADTWDPDLTLAEWWERLAESGWAVPTWPEEWFGKGLAGDARARRRARSCAAPGALGPPAGSRRAARRPDDLTHGTDEQKRALPAADRQRAGGVVPALQRARRRLRPREPADQGRARRRRVGHQRPEGVDVGRAGRRPRHAPRPHRPRRAEAQGHHVLRVPDGPAGRRGAAAARDDGSRAVQRGVLRPTRACADDAMHRRARTAAGSSANTTLANERAGLGGGGSGAGGGGVPGQEGGMLEPRVGDLDDGESAGARGAAERVGGSYRCSRASPRSSVATDDPSCASASRSCTS